MSDYTADKSATDQPINGFKPLSNVEGFSLPATGDDLSRLSARGEFSMANGISMEDMDDDDEEEVEDDYVAVDHDDINEYPYWFRRPPVHQRTKLDELHPFVQVLTVSNVDDCVNVENAFPEQERCLFTLPILGEDQPKPRPTLVGHIVATRTSTPFVTDKSMQLPANWETERMTVENGETVGHDEYGGTIAIHSLAVSPEHQGKQVASTLMKSYIQRIREAQIAERLSLIAHDHLVPFYESFGFENRGPSKCKFGSGGWTNLVLDFIAE
ncbi:hypothetical protein ETB97_006641 [Aspergillus alliaceus]|uniref:N-acetyltransferase domain-containing protein n=1 Tax=Petromyces alliaceus TaxID=209559 RepID=A0A8H5ZXF8_PETAA|nr:hypothetical protein ETB97_006641 [Aspergillus burnettii]